MTIVQYIFMGIGIFSLTNGIILFWKSGKKVAVGIGVLLNSLGCFIVAIVDKMTVPAYILMLAGIILITHHIFRPKLSLRKAKNYDTKTWEF